MTLNMVMVEFLQDYQCCWKKGQVGEVLPHFANTLIKNGIAKRVDTPQKHKMVESPTKMKGHNIKGYTG